MKKWILGLTAMAAALLNCLSAQAQEVPNDLTLGEPALCEPSCCEPSCCNTGCGGFTLGVDFEATFLRFHQSGGVQQNVGTAEYDFDFAPRIVLQAEGADGFGARLRYWGYDADAAFTNTNVMGIDTYSLDFELLQTFAANCCTTIELSGGLRISEFNQTITNAAGVPLLFTEFGGFGGTVAIEGRRALGPGSVYARARASMVMGDYATVFDHTMLQTELGMGYTVSYALGCGALLKFSAGAEFQQWEDAVFVVNQFGFGGNNSLANAGWGGFVFGAGLEYERATVGKFLVARPLQVEPLDVSA